MERISIIIPCYNEEKNIKECIKQIPAMDWETEIIVVDDGSTDKTKDVIQSINDPRIRITGYARNHGKGYAIREGIRISTGSIIAIIDADYTSSPKIIPEAVNLIIEEKADFVNGTRFIHPMEKGAMNTFHKLTNKITAFIISLAIGQHLTDTLCGLKVFRKNMLTEEIKNSSWPDFNLILGARKNNLKIAELPVYYKARKYGISKMNSWYKITRDLLISLKQYMFSPQKSH